MAVDAQLLAVALWRIRRADRLGAEGWRLAQRRNLDDLVACARKRSPHYRERYIDVPRGSATLADLPVVTKPQLMADFDAWVTDPGVKLDETERHLQDPSLVGRRLLGRYLAFTTSGVTGTRGVFLHDRRAVATYAALGIARGVPAWLGEGRLRRVARGGARIAMVAAGGGHFAAATGAAYASALGAGEHVRTFDVLQPLSALAEAIERYQPAILAGYPTAISALATMQERGSLRVAPALVATGGEWLAPGERERIQEVFGCAVRDVYAASEFPAIAFDCGRGSLHVNADWCVLEPVDADWQPAPAGKPSRSVLLTNLANRVQPILRYDLGDSVTAREGPCPCGSALPAIHVEGRRDETLLLETTDGAQVPILPLALATVVEETPGVLRFQAIQTGPATLRVRIEPGEDADRGVVWEEVERRVHAFLAVQGAGATEVAPDESPPQRDPRSGKLREVYATWRRS